MYEDDYQELAEMVNVGNNLNVQPHNKAEWMMKNKDGRCQC